MLNSGLSLQHLRLRKLKSDFASRLTSVHTRSAMFPSRRSPNDVAERLRRRASHQYTHYRARSTSAQPQVDVFWRFILPLRSRISSGWQSRRFRRRLNLPDLGEPVSFTSDQIAALMNAAQSEWGCRIRLKITAGSGCTVVEIFDQDALEPSVPIQRIVCKPPSATSLTKRPYYTHSS